MLSQESVQPMLPVSDLGVAGLHEGTLGLTLVDVQPGGRSPLCSFDELMRTRGARKRTGRE